MCMFTDIWAVRFYSRSADSIPRCSIVADMFPGSSTGFHGNGGGDQHSNMYSGSSNNCRTGEYTVRHTNKVLHKISSVYLKMHSRFGTVRYFWHYSILSENRILILLINDKFSNHVGPFA